MAELVIATLMRPTGDTGVQTHVRTFLEWLWRRAVPARLMTPYDAPMWLVYPVFALRRLINPLHGVASVWWYRYWHAFFLRLALRKRLSNGAACVVYAQCPLSADAALRARASERQRVVLVVHFNVSQADEWAGKGMIALDSAYAASIRRFEAACLPRVDGLIFVSEFMHNCLLARIPAIKQVPFAVIPNFVADVEASPALPMSLVDADLITVGTLEARKNQRYALEIIAAAHAAGHPLTLSIAGDGPDRAMLEAHAAALGIAESVRFLGYVPSASQLFSHHRACLHVATMENLPLTLIEAMARGTPVFASAVGGVPEVFSDGVEGRSLPLDDAQAAATIVCEWLCLDRERLAEAGQAARQRFRKCFRSDVAAEALHKFVMDGLSS